MAGSAARAALGSKPQLRGGVPGGRAGHGSGARDVQLSALAGPGVAGRAGELGRMTSRGVGRAATPSVPAGAVRSASDDATHIGDSRTRAGGGVPASHDVGIRLAQLGGRASRAPRGRGPTDAFDVVRVIRAEGRTRRLPGPGRPEPDRRVRRCAGYSRGRSNESAARYPTPTATEPRIRTVAEAARTAAGPATRIAPAAVALARPPTGRHPPHPAQVTSAAARARRETPPPRDGNRRRERRPLRRPRGERARERDARAKAAPGDDPPLR
jgi:hypothetical protein